MAITIDGVTYGISIEPVKRKGEILAQSDPFRTADGVLHAEAIGTYYNYDVKTGDSTENPTDYAALWQKVTEPTYDHTITIPDESGPVTFGCYFANMSDEITDESSGTVIRARSMSFSVIGTSPARTPA